MVAPVSPAFRVNVVPSKVPTAEKSPPAPIKLKSNGSVLAGALPRPAAAFIYTFGAGPEHVIYGFMHSGQQDKAFALAEKFQIDMKEVKYELTMQGEFEPLSTLDYRSVSESIGAILKYIAYSGDTLSIKQWLNLAATLKETGDLYLLTLEYAALGGHISFLEKEYSKKIKIKELGKLPSTIGCYLATDYAGFRYKKASFRFKNASLALHTLSFIQNIKFCKEVVAGIKKDCKNHWNYDLEEVNEQAIQVRELMNVHQLNYPQAVSWLAKVTAKGMTSDDKKAAVKVFQLMRTYQINEQQAVAWLTMPKFRQWLKIANKELVFNTGSQVYLPAEIVQLINSYVIGTDKDLAKFHRQCDNRMRIADHLQPLTHSLCLFGKRPVKPSVESSSALQPGSKRQRR